MYATCVTFHAVVTYYLEASELAVKKVMNIMSIEQENTLISSSFLQCRDKVDV